MLPPSSAVLRQALQPTTDKLSGDGWQRELAGAIREPLELCRLLGITPPAMPAKHDPVWERFPVLVPHSYLARMRPGDESDPLFRQVWPFAGESDNLADFTPDPVGDSAAVKAPGLLQKYAGRALLITTGICAVHCRYCFRRHYPYDTAPKSPAAWQPALDQLSDDPTTAEVILSGGDPLILGDDRLSELVDRLASIPHLRRLRVHSRLPIVLPSRVTDRLIKILTNGRLSPVMVVHANHANELQADCATALRRLTAAGVPTLNQAVLLRDINDTVAAQSELSERLIELGLTPYYLHQLDRVAGAAHYEVPPDEGKSLVAELRRRLPGYLVPRYVQEIPGAAGKTPLEFADP